MFRPRRLAARSLLPEPARLTAHVLLDALVRRDLPTRRASRRSNAAKRRIFAWAHRRSLAYLSAAWSEELARRQARIVGPHLRVARLARTRSKRSKGDPFSMTCGRIELDQGLMSEA
jgi:hypothetical protein